MMRIAIAGASGRMGRMLIESVSQSTDLELTVALDQVGSPMIGQDACAFLGKPSGVLITDQLSALAQADCLIDFTRPEGSLLHLDACVRHHVNMVIGTTGFDDAGKAAIAQAAETIGVVFAPNMSVGVNATLKLLDMAARILNAGYDVEVFEAHHHHTVDAPSGTALKMGETVANDIPAVGYLSHGMVSSTVKSVALDGRTCSAASIEAVTLSCVMTCWYGRSRFLTRVSTRTSFCTPGATRRRPGATCPLSLPSVNLRATSHWLITRIDRKR